MFGWPKFLIDFQALSSTCLCKKCLAFRWPGTRAWLRDHTLDARLSASQVSTWIKSKFIFQLFFTYILNINFARKVMFFGEVYFYNYSTSKKFWGSMEFRNFCSIVSFSNFYLHFCKKTSKLIPNLSIKSYKYTFKD